MDKLPRHLSSRRLKLCSPDPAFAQGLRQALNDSYDFHRPFLDWVRPDWSVEDVRQTLHLACKDWDESYGEKRYFLFLHSGELVGCLGLRPMSPPAYNLGYWIAAAHAGEGLMKEALRTVIDYLGDHPVWLTTSPQNLASQALAESLGFRCSQRGAARWRYDHP